MLFFLFIHFKLVSLFCFGFDFCFSFIKMPLNVSLCIVESGWMWDDIDDADEAVDDRTRCGFYVIFSMHLRCGLHVSFCSRKSWIKRYIFYAYTPKKNRKNEKKSMMFSTWKSNGILKSSSTRKPSLLRKIMLIVSFDRFFGTSNQI